MHIYTHAHAPACINRLKCAEQQNDRLREEVLQTQQLSARARDQCAASDRDAIEAKAALVQMREEVAAVHAAKSELTQVCVCVLV